MVEENPAVGFGLDDCECDELLMSCIGLLFLSNTSLMRLFVAVSSTVLVSLWRNTEFEDLQHPIMHHGIFLVSPPLEEGDSYGR